MGVIMKSRPAAAAPAAKGAVAELILKVGCAILALLILAGLAGAPVPLHGSEFRAKVTHGWCTGMADTAAELADCGPRP